MVDSFFSLNQLKFYQIICDVSTNSSFDLIFIYLNNHVISFVTYFCQTIVFDFIHCSLRNSPLNNF